MKYGVTQSIVSRMLCCRIETNAFNNEFLTNACKEWRERLSEGCMLNLVKYFCLYIISLCHFFIQSFPLLPMLAAITVAWVWFAVVSVYLSVCVSVYDLLNYQHQSR